MSHHFLSFSPLLSFFPYFFFFFFPFFPFGQFSPITCKSKQCYKGRSSSISSYSPPGRPAQAETAAYASNQLCPAAPKTREDLHSSTYRIYSTVLVQQYSCQSAWTRRWVSDYARSFPKLWPGKFVVMMVIIMMMMMTTTASVRGVSPAAMPLCEFP